MPRIRTLAYLGSKTSHAPLIVRMFRAAVPGASVITDGFCGSGAVSFALRDAGYCVVTGDLLHSASTVTRVGLHMMKADVDRVERVWKEAESLKDLVPDDHWFMKWASGDRPYFSYDNAKRIIAVRETAEGLDGFDREVAIASAILAGDFAMNTAGHGSSALRKDQGYKLKVGVGCCVPPFSMIPNGPHDCERRDVKQTLSIRSDAVYLDPPWSSSMDYSTYYSLHETIAKWDNPAVSGVTNRRNDSSRTEYETRDALSALRELVRAHLRGRFTVMSYSSEGIASQVDLVDAFGDFYEEVAVVPWTNKRYTPKEGARANGVKVREYMIVAGTREQVARACDVTRPYRCEQMSLFV